MSRFLIDSLKKVAPYVPGEQPKDRRYIKLNTNESPYPPSPLALKLMREEAVDGNLYPDPEYSALVSVAAEKMNVKKENILFTNGSDETLNFAFAAYCAGGKRAVFADITYGFYDVFANYYGSEKKIIPLKDDFSIAPADYYGAGGTVFIANPNAPTGLYLELSDIEKIVKNNPDDVVIVDEAYIDFGGESAVKLIGKYKNLLVIQTFSKSRSLAGMRIGMAIADEEIIKDLKVIKYSTNPFNLSKAAFYAAIGALLDEEYFKNNCLKIIKNREKMQTALSSLGFSVTDSKANFVFAKSDKMNAEKIYLSLKERGVLVRYFKKPRIDDHIRITVGNDEETDALIAALKSVLGDNL